MAKKKYKTNGQAVEDAIDWLIDNKKSIVEKLNSQNTGYVEVNFKFHGADPEWHGDAGIYIDTTVKESF